MPILCAVDLMYTKWAGLVGRCAPKPAHVFVETGQPEYTNKSWTNKQIMFIADVSVKRINYNEVFQWNISFPSRRSRRNRPVV